MTAGCRVREADALLLLQGGASTQFAMAGERREEYWLYVVEDSLGDPIVHPINDPASKVDQFFFDDGCVVFVAFVHD